MSNSVRPQRRQPTRLPRPWDSLGQNTGVGFHFLLQCMKVKSESEVIQSCPTLLDPMDCSLPGSSVHGIFQAKVLEWVAIAFSQVLLHNSNFCTPFKEQSYRNDPSGQGSANWAKKSLLQLLNSAVAVRKRTQTIHRNGCGCMPIKLYLQRQLRG